MKLSARNVALWMCILSLGLLFGCESVGLRSMRIYMQQQNWSRALEQGKAAVAENPQDAAAWFAIAQVASQVDSTELMLEAVSQASSINNAHDAEIVELRQYSYNDRFNRGVEAYNAGNFPAAKNHLQWAIAIDSTRSNAYKVMGIILSRENDIPGSTNMLGSAWRADTSDVEVGLRYAYLLAAQDRKDESVEVYSFIHENHPDNCDATLGYVQTLQSANRLDDAMNVANEALAAGSPCETNPRLHMRAGIILMQKSRELSDDSVASANALSQAAEKFAVAADSGNGDAAFNMALCLQQLGRLEEAIGPMERVVSRTPDDHSARMKLSEFLVQLERFDAAEAHLTTVKDAIGTPTTAEDRNILYRAHRFLAIVYTVKSSNLSGQADTLREEARNTRNRTERRAKEAQATELSQTAASLMEQAQAQRDLSESYNQ